jgi:hypothetical protein
MLGGWPPSAMAVLPSALTPLWPREKHRGNGEEHGRRREHNDEGDHKRRCSAN